MDVKRPIRTAVPHRKPVGELEPRMHITETPLVSVIIPAYNHENYVRDAIQSVIDQDYPNIEIIVLDDGSTDGTADVAKGVLSQCQRRCRFMQQENRGAHAAINTGIGLAQGDYISILNSDDLYHATRLSRLVKVARIRNAAFLFSKVRHIGADGELLPISSPASSTYRNSLAMQHVFPTASFELLRHNFAITTGNMFFTREIFNKVGGFADYQLCHDWDFILKVLLREEPFFVDDTLMSFRLHGRNTILLGSRERRAQETDAVITNYLAQAETSANELAPSWRNWGSYWSHFIDKYMQHHTFLFDDGPAHLEGAEAQMDAYLGQDPSDQDEEILRRAQIAPWRKSQPEGRDQLSETSARENARGVARDEGNNRRNFGQAKGDLLVESIGRLEDTIELLEEERDILAQEISQLKDLLSVSRLPPLPAQVYLYFAVRKLLYPLYLRLGGDRNGWLLWAKARIKSRVVK